MTIEWAKDKVHLVWADRREKMDQIAAIIEDVRRRFQRALGLDGDLIHYHRRSRHNLFDWRLEQAMGKHFQSNADHCSYINERRKEASALMDTILSEISHCPHNRFYSCGLDKDVTIFLWDGVVQQ